MSSPFENAFTQRVDKVSTALNEGNAGEAAYQMRGMVEDDPRQALRLIKDAQAINSSGAIDQITRDCAGDIFIVNRTNGESTFAGKLGSHGQAPEPIQPPASPAPDFVDQPVIQPINNRCTDWQTPYPVKEWHPHRFAPDYAPPGCPLPPECVFNGYPRPYYARPENWDGGWRNRD